MNICVLHKFTVRTSDVIASNLCKHEVELCMNICVLHKCIMHEIQVHASEFCKQEGKLSICNFRIICFCRSCVSTNMDIMQWVLWNLLLARGFWLRHAPDCRIAIIRLLTRQWWQLQIVRSTGSLISEYRSTSSGEWEGGGVNPSPYYYLLRNYALVWLV